MSHKRRNSSPVSLVFGGVGGGGSGGVYLLLILLYLVDEAYSLRCYHCVCSTDCISNNNGQKSRVCPIQYDACVTRVGPLNRIAKLCGKRPNGPVEDVTVGYFPEEKYHWCNEDLCNDGSAAGGGQGQRLKLGSIILLALSIGVLLIRLGFCLRTAGGARARGQNPQDRPPPQQPVQQAA